MRTENLKILVFFCVLMMIFTGRVWAVTHYVDPNGSGDFNSIQAAITASSGGDTIIVREGTYVENINMGGKAITLRSTDPLDGNVVLATIIDGGGSGSVITCDNGEDPNTIIDGFLIRNGTGTNVSGYYLGGGMYNTSSSPTVSNCTFSGNTVMLGSGGGMYNRWASPTVTVCTFSGNTAQGGGGMRNLSSSPTVTNCTFSGNVAYQSGGGMINESGSPVISGCTFSGNTAYEGGGMYILGSSHEVRNCTFSGNTASGEPGSGSGGGIYTSSSPTISNCTFSGNTCAFFGGGMFTSGGTPVVSNSVFCVNLPDQIFWAWTDNGGNVLNDDYCPPPRAVVEGDVDGDGDVDFKDVAILCGNWLAGVEPEL